MCCSAAAWRALGSEMVLVPVVQVQPARRQVGVLCDLAVEVDCRVQGNAGAEHAYVEVNHHSQGLLLLLRHVPQHLHMRGGAGNRADSCIPLSQLRRSAALCFFAPSG